MKKLLLVSQLFFIAFLIPCLSLAQESQGEIFPLITVEGRIISKQGRITLITAEGKGYLIKKAEGAEEVFNKVREYLNKDFDITLSGIETGETKGFVFTDYQTNQARVEEYRVIEVLFINEIKEGSKVSKIDISKPKAVEYPPLDLTAHSLKKISGKISKCNFKGVIPTIELEGKPDFAIMIPAGVEAIKVVGENLMAFKPKDVLKEGIKVEIWYEEKGYIRNARIITIQEKDIANQ
ncbi:MAG: hypothetical protein KKH29_04915 [Candidatus Omnitrophica bacterium]|nr:hypothetical protein [Candidatus Omnitrophota bacterium]MBU4472987.1 hypothetical protein [Candidatus Omnitrophota bacterium]MCG2706803.1 hypothetical protein [Candidatus Omnitrophota bacterium]